MIACGNVYMGLCEINNNFAHLRTCGCGRKCSHTNSLHIYLKNGKDAHHFSIKWISVSSESTVDKKFLAAALF